jgi:hypothetical protein
MDKSVKEHNVVEKPQDMASRALSTPLESLYDRLLNICHKTGRVSMDVEGLTNYLSGPRAQEAANKGSESDSQSFIARMSRVMDAIECHLWDMDEALSEVMETSK